MSAVLSTLTWRTWLVTVAAAGAVGLVLLAAPGDSRGAVRRCRGLRQRPGRSGRRPLGPPLQSPGTASGAR